MFELLNWTDVGRVQSQCPKVFDPTYFCVLHAYFIFGVKIHIIRVFSFASEVTTIWRHINLIMMMTVMIIMWN